MAGLAVGMLAVFAFLTFFLRVAIQLRDTGSTGLIGLREGAGPIEVASGALFIIGNLAAASSPVLVLADAIEPIGAIDTGFFHVLGTAVAAVGILVVFAAQMGMGKSWRIGVSNEQGTELVTGGLFSICRNPIYSAMSITWIGFFLMVPTTPAVIGMVMIVVALEGQVRLVEEPFMRKSHPDAYAAYERRVGRFLPGVGRLGS
jgi:protein-S-isoprenylcysteine O-methyltransferase Ste14